jgi:hypothetical protein
MEVKEDAMRGFVAALLAASLSIATCAPAVAQTPWGEPIAAQAAEQDLLRAFLALTDDPLFYPHSQEYWLADALERLMHAADDASCSDHARRELVSLLAMVGELGVAPARVTVFEYRAEDDAGSEIIGVDGIRVPGAPEEVVVDGLIAWATGNWPMTDDGAPRLDWARVGGKDVLAGPLDADGAVEYIYGSGEVALRIWAASDEEVSELLEMLP